MSNIWYGSVQNRMMERSNMPVPEVGMGVTRCMWSDRHPYEVIEIQDERHIKVREMDAKRIDKNGMSEWQDYTYTSNENGYVVDLFLTKQGRWRDKHGRKLGCDGWLIGKAEKYYDYSF